MPSPEKAKLPYGITPSMWSAYKLASAGAGINLEQHSKLRLTQTIGDAPASAGYHARDGFFTEAGKKLPYCAAIDLSVLWISTGQIKLWLDHLAWWGFAGWYRPWETNGKPNYHIHAIYAGVPQKSRLRSQTEAFLDDRTGLVGNGRETFFTGNREQDAYIRALFTWSNHGGPKPPLPPKAPKTPPPPVQKFENRWTVQLSGRTLPFGGLIIDGRNWVPVRPWYESLGITKDKETGRQLVKWMPVEQSVYVQDRLLTALDSNVAAEIKLLDVGDGNGNQGYARLIDLAAFSGLAINPLSKQRLVQVYRQ